MSHKTIALYLTKSGKEAARVTSYTTPRGVTLYSWSGSWGAGCGDILDIKKTILFTARIKKFWRCEIPFPEFCVED